MVAIEEPTVVVAVEEVNNETSQVEDVKRAPKVDLEKYKLIEKTRDDSSNGDIRVAAMGSLSSYVTYAGKLFHEDEREDVTIKATGNALTKAVNLAEVIKRRFKGLHQLTKIFSTEISDEYEAIDAEAGLENVTYTKTVSVVEITLSKVELKTDEPGYQAPLPESEVIEVSPEDLARKRLRSKR